MIHSCCCLTQDWKRLSAGWLPQEMFLEVHGTAGDSTAAQELLVREPLAPEQLPLYRILNHTPSMGPAAAHVLAQQYGNLGNLMAAEFLNPSKCAVCRLCKRPDKYTCCTPSLPMVTN